MPTRPAPFLALVCCAIVDGELAVLMVEGAAPRKPVLPTRPVPRRGDLDAAARSLATTSAGRAPGWIKQVGAVADGALVLTFAAAVPTDTEPPAGARWVPVAKAIATGGLAARLIRPALTLVRERLDRDPVAFRLLPPTFSLSDLQQVYELLLDRRLHKASFRRTLLAAHLVEPTDAWRSEGRGRPAQLFRFAPRRRRAAPRPVRFELLG